MSTSSLTLARDERKRAEVDARLLGNRLALLRAEEAKALRLVRATEAKIEAERKLQAEKEERRVRRIEEEKRRAEYVASLRKHDDARKWRKDLDERLLVEKRASASETKQEVERLKLAKKSESMVEGMRLREKAENLRRAKLEARGRVDGERLVKLELWKLEYAGRVAQEEEVRRRHEALVRAMEKEEAELISRLQDAQKDVRKANEELENVKTQRRRASVSVHSIVPVVRREDNSK
jgi:hypothetical protein